jgi:hypothetical protein
MIGNNFARLTGSKRNLLALLASSAVFTAGCANMATSAPDTNPFSKAATLSGNIHGGSQPVVNATVTLWYAGQKGNSGFPVTPAAQVTSDALGNFSFIQDPPGTSESGTTAHYSCPLTTTVASPLVYVIAAGGNTAGNVAGPSNTGAEFIGVYGNCSGLNSGSTLWLNEITTVATMAAIQQFFDPNTEGIVADGTGQQYNILNNVPSTIALLANSAAGTVVSSTTIKPAAGHIMNPLVRVTATPESTKINLLANIMASCVNQSTVAGCAPLFAAAVPPNSSYTSNFADGAFVPATDTLMAIYYLFTNASNGSPAQLATTFGLAGGATAPYQPALATQPTDWNIAINYTSTGACGTTSGGAGAFIDGPADISIDGSDNVWIANAGSTTPPGNLSELSGAGVPTTCVALSGSNGLQASTIDQLGNVWVSSPSNNSVYSFTSTSPFTQTKYAVGVTPLAIGADGQNNVYFTSAANTSLYELAGAVNTAGVTPTQISTAVGPNPVRLMPDFQGKTTASNIFVTSGAAFVSKVSPTATAGVFTTTPITTAGTSSYGLTLGPTNNLYVSDFVSGAITGLAAGTGSTYTTDVGGFPYTTPAIAGISAPTSISVDGRLNIWLPNNTNGTDASSSPAGSISYVSQSGSANSNYPSLSPATGFQRSTTYLNANRALAVDQAGNVWVAGDGNNFITEFVGAGVPLFQPYSLGLVNGRYQTIP